MICIVYNLLNINIESEQLIEKELQSQKDNTLDNRSIITEEEIIENSTEIMVEIKGEVNRPGVYTMSTNSRLYQLIEEAGGVTAEANLLAVNQAKILEDQMSICILSIHDETSIDFNDIKKNEEKTQIDINHANQSELENLPGIGPSKAQAIIKYREDNGKFKSIEELMEISGIGQKTYDKLKDEVMISP